MPESQPPPTLDYAGRDLARTPGVGSAATALCCGTLVAVEAIRAVMLMRRLDPRGHTELWMALGLGLFTGAIVAVIGLAAALYGRAVSVPRRVRQIGGWMSVAYLVGYALLIAVVAIWA